LKLRYPEGWKDSRPEKYIDDMLRAAKIYEPYGQGKYCKIV
jgi:hypothetical protein